MPLAKSSRSVQRALAAVASISRVMRLATATRRSHRQRSSPRLTFTIASAKQVVLSGSLLEFNPSRVCS